jgi:hypothetical protein
MGGAFCLQNASAKLLKSLAEIILSQRIALEAPAGGQPPHYKNGKLCMPPRELFATMQLEVGTAASPCPSEQVPGPRWRSAAQAPTELAGRDAAWLAESYVCFLASASRLEGRDARGADSVDWEALPLPSRTSVMGYDNGNRVKSPRSGKGIWTCPLTVDGDVRTHVPLPRFSRMQERWNEVDHATLWVDT